MAAGVLNFGFWIRLTSTPLMAQDSFVSACRMSDVKRSAVMCMALHGKRTLAV